jgi:hypothetical protein
MAAARKQSKPRQQKDPVTHRFQSVLSRELCDKLCEAHQEGRDFRNITAVRCGVHPVTLTRWLKLGSSDENAGLHSELFMRMAKAEGDTRAAYISEVSNPVASTEETEYADGKPVSKTVESRRTQGIQWLLERRFRQFRADSVPKVDDLEMADLLQPQATVYSLEMVLDICQQMAAQPERLPVAVRQLFANTDWAVPTRMNDGQAEPSH